MVYLGRLCSNKVEPSTTTNYSIPPPPLITASTRITLIKDHKGVDEALLVHQGSLLIKEEAKWVTSKLFLGPKSMISAT